MNTTMTTPGDGQLVLEEDGGEGAVAAQPPADGAGSGRGPRSAGRGQAGAGQPRVEGGARVWSVIAQLS